MGGFLGMVLITIVIYYVIVMVLFKATGKVVGTVGNTLGNALGSLDNTRTIDEIKMRRKAINDDHIKFGIPQDYSFEKFGSLTVPNTVLEKMVDTDQIVTVIYKEEDSQTLVGVGFLIDNKIYNFNDLKRYLITEDESIKAYYNALRAAGERDLITAYARGRDIASSRRLFIEFKDETHFYLRNLNSRIALAIEKAIEQGLNLQIEYICYCNKCFMPNEYNSKMCIECGNSLIEGEGPIEIE